MNIPPIRDCIKTINPLVHCITNPISINQCANAILSLDARPIMAEHPKEVEEITVTSNSLLLNLGNITDARMEAIKLSANVANEHNIPVMLDLVGIACSKFRRNFILDITSKNSFSAIKGNYSEIKAFEDKSYNSSGVDSDPKLNPKSITSSAVKLAKKYGTVVLASGKTDVVTDGKRVAYINNGTQKLSQITGTGCMLGAICTVFLATFAPFEAAVYSCLILGICGELCKNSKGGGSFLINLLDAISVVNDIDIKKYAKLEVKEYENF